MRVYLVGGPFGDRMAESNVDETALETLVFDQDGNAFGIPESSYNPPRFLGFRVDVQTSLPPLGETRKWSATYRKTDRLTGDGVNVWEYADDATPKLPPAPK
ncbi:MAG: hypothetical protein KGL39_46135 [Patescibacteria group bacterium]|nr:hypothetical protein [Patescibacteria group bacterium]